MTKAMSVLFTLTLFLISTITSSFAGSRSYSTGYRNNFHSRSYSHHRPYFRGHYYDSNSDWTVLGAGLLTGVAVASILYQPPRQRTIVYYNSPPVVVQPAPAFIRQQYAPVQAHPELILRRVKTTPELLNVRSAPGFSATVLSQVERDTILDVSDTTQDWLYIRTSKGQYGWIMAQYTQAASGPVG